TTPARPGRGLARLLRNNRMEHADRPRVLLKVLADGSVALAFTGRRDPDRSDRIPEGEGRAHDRYVFPGHFLPLERFCYALTGTRTRSLSDACAAVGIDGVPEEHAGANRDLPEAARCCLARAEATHRLYVALLEQHRAFGLTLPPDRVFSAASYAK